MPTQAKKDGNARHIAKLDVIKIQPYKEEGAAIRAAAKTANKSVQGYILEAVRERMERERAGAVPADAALSPGVPGTDIPSMDEAGRDTTEGPGQFPYFPDEEYTSQPIVGTSPMQDEESSPAEHQDLLSPDEWFAWAQRRDSEPAEDWRQRVNKSINQQRLSAAEVGKRMGMFSKDERDILMGCTPEDLKRFREDEERKRQQAETEARRAAEPHTLPF